MISFTFSKKLRLLDSSCFAFVFQKARRVSTSQITILSRLNSLGYPRIGLIISKKNVKYSYERNRIKRLIRESFRLRQHELPSMDFIMIVKKGVNILDNHTFLKVLERLWRHHYYLVQRS